MGTMRGNVCVSSVCLYVCICLYEYIIPSVSYDKKLNYHIIKQQGIKDGIKDTSHSTKHII